MDKRTFTLFSAFCYGLNRAIDNLLCGESVTRAFDRKIAAIFKASAVCHRIAKIRGIGPKTATAMIAVIGVRRASFNESNALDFPFTAWRDPVPRHEPCGTNAVH